MQAKERSRPIPPYVPWRTLETYFDGLKAFGPELPNVIDRDSMRTFSGAMQSWLLSALRSLNMIDDAGVPKPRLKQIVHASPEERQPMYRQVIEAEYQFLRGINLQGATPKQIEMAFESTGATGDTIRKCIAFFVGMAKAANLPLSHMLITKLRRKPSGNGASGAKGKKPKPASGGGAVTKRRSGEADPGTPAEPKPTFEVLYDLLSPDMGKEEEAAIWTLIRYLKKREGKK